MATRVVNMKVDSDWDVYIGRPSAWGNPFSHKEGTTAKFKCKTRDEAVDSYRQWLWDGVKSGRIALSELAKLDGKTLACYCKPARCHGDVLASAARWAKTELTKDRMVSSHVEKFDGPYRFLSNFAKCEVRMKGVVYPTTEHAYQAAKTLDPDVRLAISRLDSPGAAKKVGKSVELREDWESIKNDVMLALLRVKFAQPDHQHALLATGEKILSEGNTWGDTYWGVCNGRGENWLGRLLMQVRQEIIDGQKEVQ